MKSNPRKKGEKSVPRKRGKKPNAEKRGELAPVRLAEKLKQIRKNIIPKLSQGKMLLYINQRETLEGNRARVSQYELGRRVPSLVEIYNYAKFAGAPVETLLDDALDLPAGIRSNLDGLDVLNRLETPPSKTAKNANANANANAKTEQVNLIGNAVAEERGESENLSLPISDREGETSEKPPESNVGGAADEPTDSKEPNSETFSVADVLPITAPSSDSSDDEPSAGDARFQEEDTADTAAAAAAGGGIIADYAAVAAEVADGKTIYSAIAPDPIEVTISIRLSVEILNDGKIIRLESVDKTPS